MIKNIVTSLALVIITHWQTVSAQESGASPPPKAPKRQSAEFIFWHLTPSEGASPEITSEVEKKLRVFFEKQRGRLLMDGMTMDSLLLVEGNEKFLRCGVGPACVSGLGEIAGINRVIAGEVKKVEGRLIVELVLVDAKKKKVVSRTSVESAGPPGKKHMHELSVAMFEPWFGRIAGFLEETLAYTEQRAVPGEVSVERIAEAVAWLASDASGGCTGLDLPVDGGATAGTWIAGFNTL